MDADEPPQAGPSNQGTDVATQFGPQLHPSLPLHNLATESVDQIIAFSPNIHPVARVSAASTSDQDLLAIIRTHELSGQPLIISDNHTLPGWDHKLLSPTWLLENAAQQVSTIRNVHTRLDKEWSLKEYIEYAAWVPHSAAQGESERFYAKDAPCPDAWLEWLDSGVLPSAVLQYGPDDTLRYLAPDERPETLMCYLGVGDTFTPSHKDNCASTGQNLMTYTSSPDTCSLWFFTPTSASLAIAEYFQSTLETELDFEDKVLSVQQWASAPCPVYVCEQKLGDLVLVPSKSCHQVINKGGLSIKTSWSRMTVDNIVDAVREECVIYRRVCRPEIYKTKMLTYRTLKGLETYLSKHLNPTLSDQQIFSLDPTIVSDMLQSISKLVPLFDEILQAEYSSPEVNVARSALSGGVCCDFCGADIFQSFFECKTCVSDDKEEAAPEVSPKALDRSPQNGFRRVAGSSSPVRKHPRATNHSDVPGDVPLQSQLSNPLFGDPPPDLLGDPPTVENEPDSYHICAACYVEGRTCACGNMAPLQCFDFEDLLNTRNNAVNLFNAIRDHTPGGTLPAVLPFLAAQNLTSTKTNRVFVAGCHLYRLRLSGASKVVRRCSPMQQKGTVIAHDVSAECHANCPGCHRALCFPHSLEIRRGHSSDELLAGIRDARMSTAAASMAQHERHTIRPKDSGDASVPLGPGIVGLPWLDVHPNHATPAVAEMTNDKEQYEQFFGNKRSAGSASLFHPQPQLPKRGKGRPSQANTRSSLSNGTALAAEGVTGGTLAEPPTSSLKDVRPSLRLVWAASTFQTCRPINPRSALGWYDRPRMDQILDGSAVQRVETIRNEVQELIRSPVAQAAELGPDGESSSQAVVLKIKKRKSQPVGPASLRAPRSAKRPRASLKEEFIRDGDSNDERSPSEPPPQAKKRKRKVKRITTPESMFEDSDLNRAPLKRETSIAQSLRPSRKSALGAGIDGHYRRVELGLRPRPPVANTAEESDELRDDSMKTSASVTPFQHDVSEEPSEDELNIRSNPTANASASTSAGQKRRNGAPASNAATRIMAALKAAPPLSSPPAIPSSPPPSPPPEDEKKEAFLAVLDAMTNERVGTFGKKEARWRRTDEKVAAFLKLAGWDDLLPDEAEGSTSPHSSTAMPSNGHPSNPAKPRSSIAVNPSRIRLGPPATPSARHVGVSTDNESTTTPLRSGNRHYLRPSS